MQKEVFLCDRVKTIKTNTLRTVGRIQTAMSKKWDGEPHTPEKITFQYLKYTLQDRNAQVARRHGALYKVSPYKLLMNEGNYYLLAFDDRTQSMRTYRIDRMKDVEPLGEPRDGAEDYAALDMETYIQRVFSMFSGETKRTSILFTNDLLDVAIERFGTGKDVFYRPEDEQHFVVTADVDISDQFFAWVCGFRSSAQIISPPEVIADMEQFLKDIAERYKSY